MTGMTTGAHVDATRELLELLFMPVAERRRRGLPDQTMLSRDVPVSPGVLAAQYGADLDPGELDLLDLIFSGGAALRDIGEDVVGAPGALMDAAIDAGGNAFTAPAGYRGAPGPGVTMRTGVADALEARRTGPNSFDVSVPNIPNLQEADDLAAMLFGPDYQPKTYGGQAAYTAATLGAPFPGQAGRGAGRAAKYAAPMLDASPLADDFARIGAQPATHSMRTGDDLARLVSGDIHRESLSRLPADAPERLRYQDVPIEFNAPPAPVRSRAGSVPNPPVRSPAFAAADDPAALGADIADIDARNAQRVEDYLGRTTETGEARDAVVRSLSERGAATRAGLVERQRRARDPMAATYATADEDEAVMAAARRLAAGRSPNVPDVPDGTPARIAAAMDRELYEDTTDFVDDLLPSPIYPPGQDTPAEALARHLAAGRSANVPDAPLASAIYETDLNPELSRGRFWDERSARFAAMDEPAQTLFGPMSDASLATMRGGEEAARVRAQLQRIQDLIDINAAPSAQSRNQRFTMRIQTDDANPPVYDHERFSGVGGMPSLSTPNPEYQSIHGGRGLQQAQDAWRGALDNLKLSPANSASPSWRAVETVNQQLDEPVQAARLRSRDYPRGRAGDQTNVARARERGEAAMHVSRLAEARSAIDDAARAGDARVMAQAVRAARELIGETAEIAHRFPPTRATVDQIRAAAEDASREVDGAIARAQAAERAQQAATLQRQRQATPYLAGGGLGATGGAVAYGNEVFSDERAQRQHDAILQHHENRGTLGPDPRQARDARYDRDLQHKLGSPPERAQRRGLIDEATASVLTELQRAYETGEVTSRGNAMTGSLASLTPDERAAIGSLMSADFGVFDDPGNAQLLEAALTRFMAPFADEAAVDYVEPDAYTPPMGARRNQRDQAPPGIPSPGRGLPNRTQNESDANLNIRLNETFEQRAPLADMTDGLRQLQRSMAAAGLYSGPMDGGLTSGTLRAMNRLQELTGERYDVQNLAQLETAIDHANRLPPAANDTRALGRAVQETVDRMGFDPGAIDGAVGPNTLKAVNQARAKIGKYPLEPRPWREWTAEDLDEMMADLLAADPNAYADQRERRAPLVTIRP